MLSFNAEQAIHLSAGMWVALGALGLPSVALAHAEPLPAMRKPCLAQSIALLYVSDCLTAPTIHREIAHSQPRPSWHCPLFAPIVAPKLDGASQIDFSLIGRGSAFPNTRATGLFRAIPRGLGSPGTNCTGMARVHIKSVETLPEFWDRVWQTLKLAVGTARHPFHTPTIATVEGGQPRARVVVLRHADEGTKTLRFHTDWRTPKVEQLKIDPRMELCFYSPDDRLQVRATGIARLHHQDKFATERWQASALLSRRCYTWPVAPGTSAEVPTSGLSPELEGREPTEEEAAPGFEAFCVVEVEIKEIDALLLVFTGHRRAHWRVDESWNGTWRVP